MKAYKFKAYRHSRNRKLKARIDIAGEVWNHFIALQRRYYHWHGKYISYGRMSKHLTKLKHLVKFANWSDVGSQALQNVLERMDKAYAFFFSEYKNGNRRIRPPGFIKRKKYSSFTLKQTGYKKLSGNEIEIAGQKFKYSASREISGRIKTLTIKRDTIGNLWFIFVTDFAGESIDTQGKTSALRIAGFDFGLKIFLAGFDGTEYLEIESPQFFKQGRNKLRQANRKFSRKKKHTKSFTKARITVAKIHAAIVNRRNDFQWKLANKITDDFDVLVFEDLNLKAMQKLYGRKINDLAFYGFLKKVQYYCMQKEKQFVKIGRYFPSSKLCGDCGTINEHLNLHQRDWQCDCGRKHHRDRNASMNIRAEGISALGLENVRRPLAAILA